MPGITTRPAGHADRLGTYPAECTELCGAGHSLMRAPVHVVTPATFRIWLAHQSPKAPPPIGTPPPAALNSGEPGYASGSSGSSGSSG